MIEEVVATAIHAGSARAASPLVKVNCSAIPETLLEADLDTSWPSTTGSSPRASSSLIILSQWER
ncbi:MAG: sigma 54-interacting transcriptional regulator, partial [candidate division NC10 bacterium]